MAGLGGRMSTVVKAKVSKLLDRAEDPAETLDYSYQKQVEQLQNVKKGIADVVTAKKRLQMQETSLQQSVVKLDTQARQALSSGKEDLARTALERKNVAQTELQSLDTQVAELEEPAAEAHRLRAETARQDRSLPHQEGGHQGAVLRRRGPGPDLRGRHRRRRADGRRRPGDAARGRQDRKHARPRRRGLRARSGGDLRRHHRAGLRRRRHRPPAQAALQPAGGRRRAGEDEERTRQRPAGAAQIAVPGEGSEPAAARRRRSHDRPHLRRGASTSCPTSDAARLNELENDGRGASSRAAARPSSPAPTRALLDYVRSTARWSATTSCEGSDVILPPADLTFAEAGTEFTGEGLIPD